MSTTPPPDFTERSVLRQVAWRLVPFLCLLYIFNILNRTNVGFPKREMQTDLGLSPEVFNLGYGIFYFGYLGFEVPANLLLRRFGARRWIAVMLLAWGLVSCSTAAVTSFWDFYAVRILLGVAQAGFFPGVILYLTFWFPARERVRITAFFMMAIAISGVVGNPLSGAIVQYLGGTEGLTGWQWLFLLEGLPSVLLGIVVLFYLPDGPRQANWLSPEGQAWLVERMEKEEQYRQERHGGDLLRAMIDPRVWLLICVYFTVAVGANAAGAHYPTLVGEWFPEASKFEVGLLLALPSLCAVVGMTLFGAHSDRTGERRLHVAFAALVAATGWAIAAVSPWPWLRLVGLCVAQTGMMSMLPAFWSLPTSFLSGAAAAGGIALINSVGNIGGLLGPNILGAFGLPSMALSLFVGSVLVLFARHDPTLDRAG